MGNLTKLSIDRILADVVYLALLCRILTFA